MSKIAIIAPAKDLYSETFIKAQKDKLDGDVFFYFGGKLPKHFEYKGEVTSINSTVFDRISNKISASNFSLQEKKIISSLKQNQVELVLAQYGPTATKVARLCEYLKIPLITHFHGYDASMKSVIASNDFYKTVFQVSHYVIAVSNDMKQNLIEMGCPEHKVIYNPCAPDKSFYNIDPLFTKQQFLAVGRFTDKKAPYYSILAFKSVVTQYPKATLLLAGSGPLLETCKNLVKAFSLENNVRFLGVISPEEFKTLLAESLAFVQHSITAENGDQEGTPVSVLEASIAGLPVVSTRHAGIKDVIIHNETGLLCEEHDIQTMTTHMIELIVNKSFARELGRSGKQRIHQNFSMEKHISVLNNSIDKAIRS
ncbi:glycosyltransferase [uncultured Psychroserpens sp.]|uniref:glycosyltransferase n=1 Tax=uncultured Psychroserpens sp. TaxID=255436 RepID=UPI00262E6488|nr:glycosyltransferase [uncultured Psychroserpens sp.]